MANPPVNVVGSVVTPPPPICIDGGNDFENTFLDLMRERFQGAPPNNTFIDAFKNVVGSPAGTIIGHGQPGLILTGRGIDFNFGRDPDPKSISIDNTGLWEPQVKNMETPIQELMLLGCTVGAGKDGACLVWKLARALGARVRAPIGWVVPDAAKD